MTDAQDLRELIDGYTIQVENLDIMIANLDAELDSLTEEVDTITDGVMGASETSLLDRLETRRAAEGWQIVKTWGDFGDMHIKEWAIHGFDGNPWTTPTIVRGTNDYFWVTNPTTIPIVPLTMIKVQPGNIERTVIAVYYVQPVGPVPGPASNGITTVVCQPGETVLPSTIDSFERTQVEYQYYPSQVNWDSDAGLIQDMTAFETGYDQINADIDLDGTYGLIARTENITVGYDVQVLNRAKYQSFIDQYEPYAAP